MVDKLLFVLWQYALLGVIVVAAFGLGRPVAGWVPSVAGAGLWLGVPLQVSAGLGVAMVALFLAGSLGQLNALIIGTMGLIGLVMALVPVPARARACEPAPGEVPRLDRWSTWWWGMIAVVASIPLLLKPLRVPMEWDELMYHMPYARFWAEQGALTINEWLRYPLAPYNMNLLYAASLVFADDVLPHLLHALAGALTVVLTYVVGRQSINWLVGLIAAVALLYATRWGWSNAYVDLGVMLYWSCAFSALALRYNARDTRFSYLAAFFAGIAIGIKYQALFYLPVFVLVALAVERRAVVVIRAGALLVSVGGYWYLRNYWVSGDPLHPLGGHLFGFWLWNADDLVGQYADLARVRGWPPWYLLLGIAAIFRLRVATAFERWLYFVAMVSLMLWYIVSGYPRYLIPIYPMMALLSGSVLFAIWSHSGLPEWLGTRFARLDFRVRQALLPILFAAVSLHAIGDTRSALKRVLPSPEEREQYLAERFAGYDLARLLPPRAVLYQLGFEDQLYYLGTSVRGDWFGPGRYADVLALAGDANGLARHLERLGADHLLVNLAREPMSSLSRKLTPDSRFELIARSDRAVLYRLRPIVLPVGGDHVAPAVATGQIR